MGDNFFKAFFIGCFVVLFLIGAFLYLRLEQQQDDSRAVKAFISSKGKAPVPGSWKEKVGRGI